MYIVFKLYFFFFNDTATTEIYTLSLHDALPISPFGDGAGAIAARVVGLHAVVPHAVLAVDQLMHPDTEPDALERRRVGALDPAHVVAGDRRGESVERHDDGAAGVEERARAT